MDKNTTVNEEPNFFDEGKRKLKQYAQQRMLLLRLQATEKVTGITSVIITTVVIVIIALFLLIFGSITLGFWLSSLLSSYTAGFGIVALFYFVIFLFVVFFLRKIIQNFFINKIIKLFYKKN